MAVVYIKVKDYADLHGLSEKTVYNHIKSGKIKKERIRKTLGITLIQK